MNIAVIGAGAMGSLFGALLAEAGREVVLVDIWKEHVDTINREGLSVESDGKTRTVKLKAVIDPSEAGSARLVIVFVKSTHTAVAAAAAARLAGVKGTVLTLQNGMGNAEFLEAAVPAAQIVVGTTSHGATLLGPGRIRHAGKGPTVIGPWSGAAEDMARTTAAAVLFNEAFIATEEVASVLPVLWNKLVINVGINAITALTGIRNGQIRDLEATRDLSRAAVEEAVAVARALGVSIRENAPEHVFAVAEATAANRSSMGQDVDKKRPTEIDAINGYVVRSAQALGVAVPVNRALTALIQTLQAHYA